VIGLFKTEVIQRKGPWRSLEAVEFATLVWVDWFNNRRLLGPIGDIPCCAKNSAHGYGLAVVELEHTAESFTALDRSRSNACGVRRDELVAQTLMRPFLMIVMQKRSNSRPEVRFAEWHEARQALGLDGSDKTLGERVQIWTSWWEEQWRHAALPQ